MFSNYPLPRKVALAVFTVFTVSALHARLYLPHADSYITTPLGGETIIQLQDSSGSIATAQTTLNNARTANPTAILVLNLNASSYSVSTTGLVLGSNECLVLAPTTTIAASSSSATAAFLVQVPTGSHNVSIAGGTFDGAGANLNCIQVAASTRVNISDLTARNAANNIIQVYGPGQTVFDSELTVANCSISQGTSTFSGLSLHDATQAIVIDNTVTNFAGGSGLYVKNCAYCTIAENTCTSCATGINLAAGNNNAVTDNTCSSNATGILLAGNAGATSANLCTSNTLNSNTTVAISASGIGDTIFDNTLTGNAATLTLAGSANNIIPRKAALTVGQNYFYPPLIDDQQAGTIVNGKARTDVTIGSTTMSSVQTQYNTARTNNPNNVIVLHLTGSSYTGDATLVLSSYTCVLLTGTIHSNSGVGAITITGQSYVSISGGTIDAGNLASPKTAISCSSGCFMIQIDGMTLQNFGPLTPRGSGTDAVRSVSGATPFLMTRCTANQGSNRGLWLETAGYQSIVSRNTFNNFNEDGIDCDAHTATSLIKYNTCSGNYRAGIFVEQGDTYDQLIGNTLTGNHRCGISVWNNGVGANISPTEFNTAVGNICDSSVVGTPSSGTGNSTGYGLETGSQAGSAFQEYTTHNFFFNNEVESNQGTGQQDADTGQGLNGATGSVQNYYSQNIVANNGSVIGSDFTLSSNGGDLFFNSTVPYQFDPVGMSPVGSGAPIGSNADVKTPFGEYEFLSATGTGQTLTLTTPSMPAGTYQLRFGYKAYTARGQCTIKVDGVQVGGTLDEYSSTTQYLTVVMGNVTLGTGTHSIVLTVTGKNASSSAYTLTASYVNFVGQ
jgi:parallel beta-helix repeat protein